MEKKARGNTFSKMSKEQLSALGKANQPKAVEARRKNREMKETLKILLGMSMNRGKNVDVENVKAFADLKGKNVSVDQAMMIVLCQKALKGDLSAITTIRDTIGEKPTENVNVDANISKNPFDELTADELRKLIESNEAE